MDFPKIDTILRAVYLQMKQRYLHNHDEMDTYVHANTPRVSCSTVQSVSSSEKKELKMNIYCTTCDGNLRKNFTFGPSTHTHAWLQETYIPRTKKKFDRFTHSLRKGEGARKREKWKK